MKKLLIVSAILSNFTFASDVSINFVGDLMHHDSQYNLALSYGSKNNPNYLPFFQEIKEDLKNADLLSGNLEFPVDPTLPSSGYPRFNGNLNYLDGLKELSFDLLVLANNHSADKGNQGVYATIREVSKMGLMHVGTASSEKMRDEEFPLWTAPNGLKIAFLNYTFSTNGISFSPKYLVNLVDLNRDNADLSLIKKHVDYAKELGADTVIVQCHWGIEYNNLPMNQVKNNAKRIANMGVDAIVAHHPHVLQPFEYITRNDGNKTFVHYSLGNFFSGQKTFPKNIGAILNLKISKTKSGIDYTPTYITTYVRPRDYTIYNANKLQTDCEQNNLKTYDCLMAKKAVDHANSVLYYYQKK